MKEEHKNVENNQKDKIKLSDFFDENAESNHYDKLCQKIIYKEKTICNLKNTIHDLELFSSKESVFEKIDNTSTLLGRTKLKELISNPLTDINELNQRQSKIKFIIENDALKTELIAHLNELKKHEKNTLWVLKDECKNEQKILDMVYFNKKYFDFLNENENVLLFYNYFTIIFTPIYGILTPLLFLIIPYLYLRFFANVQFDLQTYYRILKTSLGFSNGTNLFGHTAPYWSKYVSLLMSIFMYLHNLYHNILISINTNKIINELHNKLISVSKFLHSSYQIYSKTKDVFKFNNNIREYYKDLQDETFKISPNIWSNKGKILFNYRNIKKTKIILNDLLNYVSMTDCYVSIATLFNINSENRSIYTLTKFSNAEKPYIDAQSFWHPYLDPKNVITNDIIIGNKNPNNFLITGPNAGGKSTLIKSLTLCILLSQTLCISPAENLILTPFKLVNTYLNIPDCKGKESLFEAEMHRARDHINDLKLLNKKDFAFVVMDEIFSSTNPQEGVSGAYAIGETLSKFENSICGITTHFTYLTKLENTQKYVNYKIPITRDKENNIIYPYKLYKGKSEQFIALELLKVKGFDNELVNNAMNLCKKLEQNENLMKNKVTEESNIKLNTELNIESNIKEESKQEEIKEELNDEELNQEIKEESKEEKKEELLKEDLKEESKEDLKEESKEDLKEESKEESKENLKEESKEDLKEESKEESKENLKEEKLEEQQLKNKMIKKQIKEKFLKQEMLKIN